MVRIWSMENKKNILKTELCIFAVHCGLDYSHAKFKDTAIQFEVFGSWAPRCIAG